MRQVTEQNFGVLIAYVLPGWIALFGISELSPEVKTWLGAPASNATIGGFLYSTMSAVAIGLILNMVRQSIVETIVSFTTKPSSRRYSELHSQIDAINFLVLNQFRFHQFYGNSAIAASFSLCILAISGSLRDSVVFAILGSVAVMIHGSIKCLRVYNQRLDEVLDS